ncbi:bifunctional 2-dehydro-3-deoxygluconokinase/2-dehydro-3-deoxygalactonokinase [Natronobacterium gregoryi]|uniref:PfkB domain-containing protein n=2 Tax=Natronobacterium gregoryi TaxID=44930 RepID=L0AJ91_NATGS|nr:bifunctional 2-dehydro-3-deoxygluconokinase/2-dehydro-3-deoxygalactonokinase [Natronobacterium gregoryi]AFZ73876.1 sugar kinase, ribokinase [Natronobacterium gregoryi SP2]ELY65036.1 PfkB domain-containing protein [Natronobacterium gregoryi SP2]PLK18413.1 sugar kinase [Natronobacterium gregoryi SP2]SFJ71159.1 2-keto-3-deoxygluconate kinase [Natronobacterium gregoryi]
MSEDDLVAFGETMLRLSPPGNERIESADEFEVRAGGAESNVAIAAQRLGLSATWLSKVPETPLGRRAVGELRKAGIETDVVWSHRGRQGTYYLERAGEPRGANVIYDRENTAVSTAKARELDLERIKSASVFFTTGITPALSSTLRDTTASLIKAAQTGGTTTAVDFNYRRKLWSPEEAKETMTHLFPGIDLLVIAARDARTVLGIEGDPRQLAHRLGSEYDLDTVVVTRGAEGAVGWHDGVVHEQPAYETDTVSKVGTGDAFTGAFIARRLDGDDVSTALEYAAATAALKRTIPGDIALVTEDEIEAVVREGGETLSR